MVDKNSLETPNNNLFETDLDYLYGNSKCRIDKVDRKVFFPPENNIVLEKAAKAICYQCVVRSECGAMAIASKTDYGIFGGMNANQRRLLAKNFRKDKYLDKYDQTNKETLNDYIIKHT